MFAEERQQKIYDLICQEKSMRVQQLSKLLNTSEVTVRRDLEELHRQKKIIRTHGGAVAYYPVGKSIKVPELMADTRQLLAKQAIAQAAYGYINDYDTILLDGSSTVYELVKLLARNEKKNLIIITTSALTVVAPFRAGFQPGHHGGRHGELRPQYGGRPHDQQVHPGYPGG